MPGTDAASESAVIEEIRASLLAEVAAVGGFTFSAEQKARLLAYVTEGYSVRQACRLPDMPARSTVYYAIARDKDFADRYQRAVLAQSVMWEDEIIEIADDGSNDYVVRESESGQKQVVVDHDYIARSRLRIDTRKWIMAKRHPKKYGDKVTTTLEGGDKPIQIEASAARDRIADRIESIAARNADSIKLVSSE